MDELYISTQSYRAYLLTWLDVYNFALNYVEEARKRLLEARKKKELQKRYDKDLECVIVQRVMAII